MSNLFYVISTALIGIAAIIFLVTIMQGKANKLISFKQFKTKKP